MADPWYEVVSLVGTNLLLLPTIIIAFHPKVRLYILGLLSIIVMLTSAYYHLGQTHVFTYETLEYAQNADHIWAGSLMWYTVFVFLLIPPTVRVSYLLVLLAMMTNFTGHLVSRLNFYYAFVLFLFIGTFLRFYVFPIRGRRYGLTFIFLGFFFFLASLPFFYLNDGVGKGNYWWTHSWGWHACAFLGIDFLTFGYVYHVHFVWDKLLPTLADKVEY